MFNSIFYLATQNKNCFEKIKIFKDGHALKEFSYFFPYNFSLTRCYQVNYHDIISRIDFNEFCNRLDFNGGIIMEQISNKYEELSYSDDDIFNITSWGADLSFRELITMYNENDLVKPSMQRNYVWKLDAASRLIDSILLGLPIPSIFLAKKGEQLLIIDGYQRIRTVYDFVKGVFSQNNKVFKLSNSVIINQRWRGKTFAELTEDEKRRIKNSTLHAIIFEQKKPNNDTGMFQIFERINTSGQTLSPQEIRNCVYHGPFNQLLIDLNKNPDWRSLLNCREDIRMVDIENILRFFAISDIENTEFYDKTQIILKKFLNSYMALKIDISGNEYNDMKINFEIVMKLINHHLGSIAFNNVSTREDADGNALFSDTYVSKFHPTIFEAVTSAFLYAFEHSDTNILNSESLKAAHLKLLNDPEFKDAISVRTTNLINIKKRITLATKYLFGLDYEWR